MTHKTKAIIIGGGAAGLISSIPIIGWLWIVWTFLGGALAAFLFVRKSDKPVQLGEGVVVGVLAGLVSGVVNLIGYTIFQGLLLLLGVGIQAVSAPGGDMGPALFGAAMGGMMSIFWIIFNAILIIPIAVLSLLGGLASTAIFEKRKLAA